MVAYYQPPVPTFGAGFNGVVRDDDHAWIPDDPNNLDWVAYQEWIAAGNVAQPYTAMPQAVPS